MKTGKEPAALPLAQSMALQEQIQWVVRLSVPAILAEISSIAMQYIDAAMVGSLGGNASAAVGLVTSTTWLFNGLCVSAATGFSVQVAQLIGADKDAQARSVLRQAILGTLCFGLVAALAGIGISFALPRWLGGEPGIRPAATQYFLIYACALPASQLRRMAGNMLQCSGDMRTPSALNVLMCLLDILFNSLLIFPTRHISLFGGSVSLPGAGMGVAGAALGTALSELAVAVLMLYALCLRSPKLRLKRGGSWRVQKGIQLTALRLALPMALERVVLSGAQILSTRIIAPLGTISVAANSLAVTAESLCYMPGYGIGSASTTLVGQSIGAGRTDLARRFAYLSTALGVAVMACSGALMFLLAPLMFSILTPDTAIQALGVRVLQIEAFAEPLYAVSIVVTGALRGAGDTLAPSILNLISMWGVRITAAFLLAPRFGLVGVWLAMCGELCIRGILFLIRLLRGKWLTLPSLAKNGSEPQ